MMRCWPAMRPVKPTRQQTAVEVTTRFLLVSD
jgi:hypothetical protein